MRFKIRVWKFLNILNQILNTAAFFFLMPCLKILILALYHMFKFSLTSHQNGFGTFLDEVNVGKLCHVIIFSMRLKSFFMSMFGAWKAEPLLQFIGRTCWRRIIHLDSVLYARHGHEHASVLLNWMLCEHFFFKPCQHCTCVSLKFLHLFRWQLALSTWQLFCSMVLY